MRLGFFGGSFNPPTNAHIYIAKEAIHKMNLDKVIFVPMGDEYKKKNLAKAKDRYNMLKIACESCDKDTLEVSDIEINISKNLDTIDAFCLIEEKYPNDEKFFIMGADNFTKITEWKNYEELIANYNYIVFEREGINLSKFIEENDLIKKHISKINVLDNVEHKACSSSKFRNYKNAELIQKGVLDYIVENKLYL